MNNVQALRPQVQHETAMREIRWLKRRATIQEGILVAIITIQLLNLAVALR